jgi:glycosyltransferase involved in cell wall biosynthesis
MIVGLDASRAARARPTGTETYSLALIKALAKLAGPSHRLRLYTAQPPQHSGWPESPYVETRVIPWPRLWTHLRLAAELKVHPPDILFVPAHVLPLYCPVRALVTIHDLGYLYYPETHRGLDRRYLDWTTRRHTRIADGIIADSMATRHDLIDLYGADAGRISVVYLGWDNSLAPVEDQAEIDRIKTKLNIDGEYLLYLGTLHPRKNLVRLIEAYHMAIGPLPRPGQGPQLVIAGRKGWLYDEIFARVQDLNLADQVIFTGYVSDETKPGLISGALAYLFPSLYEGFGLPVLEAMACGTPVLTSNVSSLPEVAGNAALLVDPQRTEDISRGITELVTGADLRCSLIERGLHQIQKFSWDKAAAQILELLESTVGR